MIEGDSVRQPQRGLGLCSGTFRAAPAPVVARLAAEAGIETIEWGADVHAPPREPEQLTQVARVSREFGLRICSYGSYYRAGDDPDDDFPVVARAAQHLGAPRVRVWAGSRGSAQASPTERDRVVTALRSAADLAVEAALELALEFHDGTLADTPAAVRTLLSEVDRVNVRSYWQPPVGLSDEAALAGLEEMIDLVSGVHVFSWWPGSQRLHLAERNGLWQSVLGALERRGALPDTLLEFVPNDDPALLAGEAATLGALRGAVGAT